MTQTLIAQSRYQFYADYFALAAEAGLEISRAIFRGIDPLERVNFTTFSVYENAITSRNTLLTALKSSYEQIFTNAVSLDPMRDAFVALSDHIVKYSGQTIDGYLTDKSIQVPTTYAKIHRLSTGETISIVNIED